MVGSVTRAAGLREGLGLAGGIFDPAIIEADGGRIALANRPDGGLSVALTLPD